MIRIKICGNTSPEDALVAVKAGADAIGLIFYDKSPRYVTPEKAKEIRQALPPHIRTVGVFVNESPKRIQTIQEQVGFHFVQLHGDETSESLAHFAPAVIKAVQLRVISDLPRIEDYHYAPILLLDTPTVGMYGGSGRQGDPDLLRRGLKRARENHQSVLLAGGLTPENVAPAISAISPDGVDVVSGVEKEPGKKDPAKVRKFVEEAKKALHIR